MRTRRAAGSDQIDTSVNYLAAHWQGPWNHGLVQDLKLMRIGCAYPPDAFGGDALKWRKTADNQILSSFQPNRLGPSIDPQGAVAVHRAADVLDSREGNSEKCGSPMLSPGRRRRRPR
jgi:hypothetical protein